MIALVLLVILFGALHGFIQGMIMTKQYDITSRYTLKSGDIGIRSHMAFGLYHLIFVFYLISYAGLVLAIHNIWSGEVIRFILFLLGLIVIGWRVSEAFYSIARWAKVEQYEHFNFIDIISFKLYGFKWALWSFWWIFVGITLLLLGGK